MATTTAVLLVHNATPDTILQFHDQLSNELPITKGRWNFNFKIFRNNQYSIPQNQPELTESKESKFLYTLSPSYLIDSTICLINNKSSGVFTNSIEEEVKELGHSHELTIPNFHLHLGATTGLNDKFDFFTHSKLQSLWLQRQLIKGDGGQIYELENGNLCFRTSNVFLHGNFRGLLIQIEINIKEEGIDLEEKFNRIKNKYNIPDGNLCCDVINSGRFDKYGDLCLQYSKILNF
ncbi:unnamed protein product [Candida verbasci]|uniref:Mediator of RNA polymerase II transcription subunit 20 n=1 Tax=Candida verbasci TaxID=1227364 RepID=A0A9W4TYL9_9ASCO|nr:unnamed protein product [Candida verbasci]